jgi:hypothetical protein
VHEGATIDISDIEIVQIIAREVLFCLLRLQKNYRQRDAVTTVNAWLRNLDLIASSLEADHEQTENFYQINGIELA